jgi:hypothetical protein
MTARKVPAKKAPARKKPAQRAALKAVPGGKAVGKRPARKAPAKKAPPRAAAAVVVPEPAVLLVKVQALIDARRAHGDEWTEREEALAEVALALARKLPHADLATAAVARELRATLHDLAPKDPTDDDDLAFLADSGTPVGNASK